MARKIFIHFAYHQELLEISEQERVQGDPSVHSIRRAPSGHTQIFYLELPV